VGRDCDICLRATDHPEFDAWRWNHYWVPLDAVIEFKREVYQLALTELSRFLRRAVPRLDDLDHDASVADCTCQEPHTDVAVVTHDALDHEADLDATTLHPVGK